MIECLCIFVYTYIILMGAPADAPRYLVHLTDLDIYETDLKDATFMYMIRNDMFSFRFRILPIAYCILYIAYCLLHSACCPLHLAHCVLPTE